MKKIFERIKALRIQSGLTQEEIAQELGINFSNYGKIERGATKSVSFEKIIKLAEIFDVNVDYFVSGDYRSHNEFQSELSHNEELQKQIEILNTRIKELESWLQDKEELLVFYRDKYAHIDDPNYQNFNDSFAYEKEPGKHKIELTENSNNAIDLPENKMPPQIHIEKKIKRNKKPIKNG